MSVPGVYCVRCGDVAYVGETKSTGQRFRQHRLDLQKNKHPFALLQEAYNSGEVAEFIVLCELSGKSKDRLKTEDSCIEILQSFGIKTNRTNKQLRAHTLDTKRKISATLLSTLGSLTIEQKALKYSRISEKLLARSESELALARARQAGTAASHSPERRALTQTKQKETKYSSKVIRFYLSPKGELFVATTSLGAPSPGLYRNAFEGKFQQLIRKGTHKGWQAIDPSIFGLTHNSPISAHLPGIS